MGVFGVMAGLQTGTHPNGFSPPGVLSPNQPKPVIPSGLLAARNLSSIHASPLNLPKRFPLWNRCGRYSLAIGWVGANGSQRPHAFRRELQVGGGYDSGMMGSG
jgi:hypothetical protein